MKKLTLIFLTVMSLGAVAEEEKKKGFDTVGEMFVATGHGIDNVTNAVSDGWAWLNSNSARKLWVDKKGNQFNTFFGLDNKGDNK